MQTEIKTTNEIRHVDDLGRIVIPKKVRLALRIEDGAAFEIFMTREGDILLKRWHKQA